MLVRGRRQNESSMDPDMSMSARGRRVRTRPDLPMGEHPDGTRMSVRVMPADSSLGGSTHSRAFNSVQ